MYLVRLSNPFFFKECCRGKMKGFSTSVYILCGDGNGRSKPFFVHELKTSFFPLIFVTHGINEMYLNQIFTSLFRYIRKLHTSVQVQLCDHTTYVLNYLMTIKANQISCQNKHLREKRKKNQSNGMIL